MLLTRTRAAMFGALLIAWWTSAPAAPSSPFAALADEYLDAFAARHPSIAAGNGIHDHDDKLEDFSASAVASEVAWLRAFASRLDALDSSRLDTDEQVDRRILIGIIDGWLLDLQTVKTWTRNPMIYAAAISDGVHNLMTMDSAPAERRMDQAAAKLRDVPRLLLSARKNVRNPPRVFVERAMTMLHATAELVATDLPLAFAI